MASVYLHRDEVRGDQLPHVCAKCGEPAESAVRRKFSWCPSWVLALILVGLLPWLIVTLVLTKKMTVEVPMCERHKSHWSWRFWTVLLSLMGGVVVSIAVAVVIDSLPPRARDESLLAMRWVVPLALGFVWLIAAALISTSAIQAGEITDVDIKLTLVSAAFRDAVHDDRRAQREDRDAPSRPRGRKEDIGNRDDDRFSR